MEGRNYEGDTSLRYRFGFNGKEKDNETYGDGNAVDFGERIYDSRLGKWLSIDPLFAKYPNSSPFNYAFSNPVCFIDIGGMDVVIGIVAGTPGPNFSLLGVQALQKSKVISDFVNQFTSTTRGSQAFQVNTITKTNGQYSNNVTLSFNSVPPTAAALATMAGQDAQTTFMVRLPVPPGAPPGAPPVTIPLALWNPAMGSVGVDVNVAVLQDNFAGPTGFLGPGSNGNSRCLAAAYTSIAFTSELYSDVSNFVNILQANTVTNADGTTTVNYIGVATALQAVGVAPVSPNLPAAQADLSQSNDNKASGFLQWSVTSNAGVVECMDTHTTGDIIQNAIPTAAGAITNQTYVGIGPLVVNNAPGIAGNSVTVQATPDANRTSTPRNECR